MANWGQLGLLDSASTMLEELMFVYDHVMLILLGLMCFTMYMLVSSFFTSMFYLFMLESYMLEWVWSFLPILVLLFLAFPSISLLYLLEEVSDNPLTVKITGYQWYWHYEYLNLDKIVEFDSYLDPMGMIRNLMVDNMLFLPMNCQVRFLVTSADVIHSWALPSLGLKMDAVPGRLNQMYTFINRGGLFYGQCSELCGANHSFMPIVVMVTSMIDFKSNLVLYV